MGSSARSSTRRAAEGSVHGRVRFPPAPVPLGIREAATQLIVADGKTVWGLRTDLQQVSGGAVAREEAAKDELGKNYHETFGRKAKDPIQKWLNILMLKDIYELFDVDLVKRT